MQIKLLLPQSMSIILLFSCCLLLNASSNDSSLELIKKKAFESLRKEQYDTSRHYFNALIEKYHDRPRVVGMSYNNLGVIDLEEGFTIRGLDYAQKAIDVYREFGNDSLIAKGLYGKGYLLKELGQYDKAVQLLLESVVIFEELSMNRELSSAYNILGNIYKRNNDLDKSFEYNSKSLRIAKVLKDSMLIASRVNNRGKIYFGMERFEEAIESYLEAEDMKLKTGNVKSLGNTYYNLGETYYELDKTKIATAYFNKALTIHQQYKNKTEIAYTLNYLALLASLNNEFSKAIEHLKRAERIANEVNDPDLLMENYHTQEEIYLQKGGYKSAYSYLKKSSQLYKEILNAEKQKTIEELEIKYEVEKKDQKNLLLEKQTEIDKLQIIKQESSIRSLQKRNLIVLFGLIVTILLGYWFYLLSQKSKKQAQLEKEFALKERRFNIEQHHRIKNHLQLLAGLLSFQQRKLANVAAKEVIEESSNRIKVITTLHQHFYQSEDLSTTTIQLDRYLDHLIGNLVLLFKRPKIKVIKELEATQIEADKAIPLGLICNEIITNAYKYGLDAIDPVLHITLEEKGQSLNLSIADNGSGMEGETKESSIGIEVIQQMVKQIGAQLIRENGAGLKYTIVV